jgi:PAS domain S-box-containing protein
MGNPEFIPPPSATTDDEMAALRAIAQGTAAATGEEFFRSLVTHLAAACGVQYAFVTEFSPGAARVRTLAFWCKDRLAENVEYDLAGTPCEDVLKGTLCHHPTGVRQKFSGDRPLVEWGIESFLGVPLLSSDGRVLGHLAVFDERPMPEEPRRLFIFRTFAARAAAELERLRLEQELAASEERYRDLFEEAPIAYVKEDLESRFIRANRAAMRILGITPEEVPGTVGMSFVPDTPDAQRRVQEAFASIGRGTDTGGAVLELRRKDNGQPIWIQWWSRPEPGGQYTRTMFIDITNRVLIEQEKNRLTAQNQYLQEEIKAALNFDEIIGRSPALAAVLEHVQCVAPTDASVLITGETGTGKELIARAIHACSKRRDKPLIKVNCAALPAGLVESELFGHEKGAFTGAFARRVGRFELADGGTIFLDEIGELPLEMQAKLLRVLQEGELDRIGGMAPVPVDVRVIAATNRDLVTGVRDRTFREDLFYRLNVFPIQLPPLRDRGGDIPVLAHYFAMRFAAQLGKTLEGITPATVERLTAYRWPGNIRELENVIERAVILTKGPLLEIGAETLVPAAALSGMPAAGEKIATAVTPAAESVPPGAETPRPASLEDVERKHILNTLQQTGWRIEGSGGAAAILGLHPNTLRSRMRKLGISRPAVERP